MDEFVLKLSQGDHPIGVGLRLKKTITDLKKGIDEFGFVHIRFTGTRWSTQLGLKLDKEESEIGLGIGRLERGTRRIKLSGRLKLNDVPVKCIAEIDLATPSGVGHVQILGEGWVHGKK